MHPTPTRWHREPMAWLVWGLPAAVVVAGFATLAIAIRAGGSDATADPVQRMAQVQTTDIEADRVAAARGLAASLRIHGDQLELQLLGSASEQALTLRLSHPARAEDDRELSLRREGDRWTGRVALPNSAHWQVSLVPDDRSWRLDGELDASTGLAILKPRFGDG
ncbi:MAG: FixH family protein [Xanthomonadales bacterium]|nr:FixH family protein [Xanthomonadales bacterium]